MDDEDRQVGAGHQGDAEPEETGNVPAPTETRAETQAESSTDIPLEDESLVEELAALIDDGRTYAQAEIAFQKTRAALVGKHAGLAALYGILALILLNIAFLALAVGLVLALEPMVTIWGAIGIVVGGLVVVVLLLTLGAIRRAGKLSQLFEAPENGPESGDKA